MKKLLVPFFLCKSIICLSDKSESFILLNDTTMDFPGIRKFLSNSVRLLSPDFLNSFGRKINIKRLGDKVYKASDILLSENSSNSLLNLESITKHF